MPGRLDEHANEDDAAQHLAVSHSEEGDSCDERGRACDCSCEVGGKGDGVLGLFQWVPTCRFHFPSRFHLVAHGDGFSFNGTFTFSHFHTFKKGFPVLAYTSN